MKNIAVEKGLSTVTDYLNAQGYNVEEIDPRQRISKDFIDGFDVVVISGMDKDRMGDETTVAKTSIIDASGLTPKDIKDEIERRLQQYTKHIYDEAQLDLNKLEKRIEEILKHEIEFELKQ